MPKGKKKAIDKGNSRGAMATARTLAKKAEAGAAAKKNKRQAPQSDEEDELPDGNINNKDGVEEDEEEEEEEEQEEQEEEDGTSSSSSSVAVEKQSTRSEIKKGVAKLETLKGTTLKIEEQIAAAKEKNAAKVQELLKTKNDYPDEVSAFICCLQIRNTDFCLLQAAPESKKKL
jgi:hypothetical protein